MSSDDHYPNVAHVRARVHEIRLFRFILKELKETIGIVTLEELDDALAQLEGAYDRDLRKELNKLL